MAEVLEGYEFSPGRGKYPWDQWTDGRVWKVEKGKDFSSKTRNFTCGILHAHARNSGKRVRVRKIGDTVIFQFYKPEEKETP